MTQEDIIKKLNLILNGKECLNKDAAEKLFFQSNPITETTEALYNAILSRIEFEKAKINFKNKSKIAEKSLVVISRKRQIGNLSIVISKHLVHGTKYIKITNIDNDYTIKGHARPSQSDLALFKDVYRNSKQVKRDITLFYQIGDEINVFESYTSGLIFKLTKINTKTVVFSCGNKKITVDRYTPTFRNKDERKLCCRINVSDTNCSKENRDINPIEGGFHKQKYKKGLK